MKYTALTLSVVLFCGIAASAQGPVEAEEGRKMRVVVTDASPTNSLPVVAKPVPTPLVVGSRPRSVETEATSEPVAANAMPAVRTLSFGEIKSKIADAKRQLQARPVTTASVGARYEGVEIVRVAFHDWNTNKIDFVVMTKEAFLSTASDVAVTSENGVSVVVKTIRGNGVNTPVRIIDSRGITHLPILVQYPRVDKGVYQETAYYMSTHPGLVTPEVVAAGQIYVRNVIDIARQKLSERGIFIEPKTADVAERLAAVEHVDHLRFRTEAHKDIYNDVYTLFALNEGQTYRYAVSSAGAGGMVQMIPSTYRMVRAQYPQVPLNPDFVDGMRDHVNASKAMLLYMQWTWDDLKRRPAIADALYTGIATREQLMSAGYNSNPARLAGYISRGGPGWTNLIPKETQIYLQIYGSVERYVPMRPRER